MIVIGRNDREKCALVWLAGMTEHSAHCRHAQAIQDLLAEPRLAAPKTKTAWEVRYNDGCWSRYYSRDEALENVGRRLKEGHRCVEIRESEVPA